MKRLYVIKTAYGRGKMVGAIKAPKSVVYAVEGAEEVLVGPYYATKELAKLVRKSLNKNVTKEDADGKPYEQEVFEHQIAPGPDHWRSK